MGSEYSSESCLSPFEMTTTAAIITTSRRVGCSPAKLSEYLAAVERSTDSPSVKRTSKALHHSCFSCLFYQNTGNSRGGTFLTQLFWGRGSRSSHNEPPTVSYFSVVVVSVPHSIGPHRKALNIDSGSSLSPFDMMGLFVFLLENSDSADDVCRSRFLVISFAASFQLHQ